MAPRETQFPVVEIFGPTIQGEGALAGRPTHFVRFGGCDYACRWCDSSHAVLANEVRRAERLTASEIVNRVCDLNDAPQWVTLSGGNPALLALNFVVSRLHDQGFKVAVETQGSKWKPWLRHVDQLTVSPKPPSSGMSNEGLDNFIQEVAGHWELFDQRTCLKVPVFDETDYLFARELHLQMEPLPFYLSVVTRMGGLHGDFDGGAIDTQEDVINRYKWLVERASKDNVFGDVAIFPQLHVLLWSHDRGH